MLKILIVEDEKIEREALFHLVKEHFSEDFSDVHVVNNGADAYRIFCEQKCDIVLSDIDIPMMNGLELIKKVKEKNPHVKCLILTSYNYFEYAQEAIRIGVDDFILKPSQDKEIVKTIHRAVKEYIEIKNDERPSITKLKEIHSIIESDCVYAILINEAAQKINFFLSVLNIQMKYGLCLALRKKEVNVAKFSRIIEEHKGNEISILCEPYMEFYIVFLFSNKLITKERLDYAQSVLLDCFPLSLKIGLGNIKENIEDLHYSFLEAIDQLNTRKSIGIHQELKENNIPTIEAYVNSMICEIERAIKLQNKEDLIRIVDNAYEYVEVNQKDVDEFLKLFIVRMKENMEPNVIFDITSINLPELANKKDKRIYMTYVVRNNIEQSMKNYRKNMNKLVVEAYKFIQKNYHKSIALNDLAEYLDVTPQYISSLLSKTENNNFTNLVADYRIEKAKELLKTNVNIKNVADMVGFQNHNYFTNIFKKKTGMTPKEYINSNIEK